MKPVSLCWHVKVRSGRWRRRANNSIAKIDQIIGSSGHRYLDIIRLLSPILNVIDLLDPSSVALIYRAQSRYARYRRNVLSRKVDGDQHGIGHEAVSDHYVRHLRLFHGNNDGGVRQPGLSVGHKEVIWRGIVF
jgi:hypothetical protein